jgi:hypothetical protein
MSFQWVATFKISPDLKELALFFLGAFGLIIESITPGSRELLVTVYAAMATTAVGFSSGRKIFQGRNGGPPPAEEKSKNVSD